MFRKLDKLDERICEGRGTYIRDVNWVIYLAAVLTGFYSISQFPIS